MNRLLPAIFLVTMFFPTSLIAQNTYEQRSGFVQYAERLREIRLARPGAFSGSMQEIAEEMQKIVFGDNGACENYAGFITYFSAPRGHPPTAITRACDILEKIESPMEVESLQFVRSRLISGILCIRTHVAQFPFDDNITPLANLRAAIDTGDVFDTGSDSLLLPVLYSNRLLIPKNYASLGLYNYAWRSYLEHANSPEPEAGVVRSPWANMTPRAVHLLTDTDIILQ